MIQPQILCPLCRSSAGEPYFSDPRRDYLRCPDCALVHVPPDQRLNPEAEKAEYDCHQNCPEDADYRRFLSRLCEPLCQRLAPGSRGLDVGCGPGPTLSVMLEERGHTVALYDPFYHPDKAVLDARYDFITLSEVIEHVFDPGRLIHRLRGCLEPGGWLAILTQQVIDRDRFAAWRYKDDPTHVCFYSRPTFDWIAARWGMNAEFLARDVVLLGIPDSGIMPRESTGERP